jgi:Domain of unknown function (DUF4282)
MAGQPQEPTYQPSGQDAGLTQGRPAWQQPPSYSPPPAASGGQPSYSAPAYGAQDQAYGAQDQTYTSLGQDYQNYQNYQQPSYGAQPGQGQAAAPPPAWQGIAGAAPGRSRARQSGDKGFIGSLFDFSFTSMVTPKIIKVLYVLAVLWTVLFALIYVVVGFSFGGFWGGVGVIILVAPIMLLLGIGISRVVLEAFMVAFKIHDELKAIREQGENRS